MAYDKVVDSAQLDAGLASVADAIRAKGGTDAQLTFPAGFTAAIQAIESSSRNHGIIARDVITATESMTIFEVLNAVEVKCTYKNSLLLMGCYDDVAPTRGAYTISNYYLFHLGQTMVATADMWQAGLKSFATFKTKSANEDTGGMRVNADGRLRRNSQVSESCCVAAGGTFKLIEVPINRDTFLPDLTLWSET